MEAIAMAVVAAVDIRAWGRRRREEFFIVVMVNVHKHLPCGFQHCPSFGTGKCKLEWGKGSRSIHEKLKCIFWY